MNVVLLTEYLSRYRGGFCEPTCPLEAARTNIDYSPLLIEPNQEHAKFYQAQYRKFLDLKKRI